MAYTKQKGQENAVLTTLWDRNYRPRQLESDYLVDCENGGSANSDGDYQIMIDH